MKSNSRPLVRDLCAAGAAALLSAILIAGCASGQRTAKFWDKGDVKSSDAYAAAELQNDQAVAANAKSGKASSGKIATVGGTQDNAGHASLPDFPDQIAFPEPTKANPSASASAKDNAGSADAGGTIVAPYVQKVAPSGVVDNSRHEGEIVAPKPVLARKIDPFADTDAEPFVPGQTFKSRSATAAAAVSKSAPSAAPVPSPSTPANADPFAEVDDALPRAAATRAQTAAHSAPATAAANPPAADPFDAATPPPPPPGSAALPVDIPPAKPQPVPAPIARAPVAAAPTAAVPTIAQAKPATVPALRPQPVAVVPPRPRYGVRLNDELKEDEDPQQQPEPAAIEQTATLAPPPPPSPMPSAAKSPYESDSPAPSCAAPNATSAKRPANAPAAAPVPDTWDSASAIQPPPPAARQPIPTVAPAAVIAPPTGSAPPLVVPTEPASIPVPSAARTKVAAAPEPADVAPARAAAKAEAVAVEHQSEVPSHAQVHAKPTANHDQSDPMICDSVAVHGRYTGEDGPAPGAAPSHHDDEVPATLDGEPPAIVPPPTAKKAEVIIKQPAVKVEGKSTSYWDEAAPPVVRKQTVSNADFSVSVPAPPALLESDELQPHDAKIALTGSTSIAAAPASQAGRPRSHAWFGIGIVVGLAVAALVWRRRGNNGQSQLA
jgi:hypothetical protein